MKQVYFLVLFIAFITIAILIYFNSPQQNELRNNSQHQSKLIIDLPTPNHSSKTSIEESLLKRRSVREFEDLPLNLREVSQLLWAAQGIKDKGRYRTAPSAGALYPLEIYIVINNVVSVSKGVYKYNPTKHQLERVLGKDIRKELSAAALGQKWIERASAVIVLSAVYERTTVKYGDRGIRYVHIEVGHAAQNIYLQAVSLNLGTTFVGAFKDEEVKRLLNFPPDEHPLSLMVVGKIK